VSAIIVLAVLGGIGIRGQVACPTVQQIHDRVEGLIPPDADNLHWVEVTEQPDGLKLSLWSPSLKLEAVRTIPKASCDELARASAVAIATWAAKRPTPIAVEPAPDRIFDAQSLAALKRQAFAVTAEQPDERPLHTGPLITLCVGTAFVASGIGLALSMSQSPGNDARGATAAALAVIGTGTLLAGVVWWLQQVATAPHDAEL
jgi:hypothetical protein